MVLPAFGVLTGGLNMLDRAFAPLFAAASLRAIRDQRRPAFSGRLLSAQAGLTIEARFPRQLFESPRPGSCRSCSAAEGPRVTAG